MLIICLWDEIGLVQIIICLWEIRHLTSKLSNCTSRTQGLSNSRLNLCTELEGLTLLLSVQLAKRELLTNWGLYNFIECKGHSKMIRGGSPLYQEYIKLSSSSPFHAHSLYFFKCTFKIFVKAMSFLFKWNNTIHPALPMVPSMLPGDTAKGYFPLQPLICSFYVL